jgi:diadenylate cyclase
VILCDKLISLKNSFYAIINSTEGGYAMLSYGTVQTIIQTLRMVLDIVLMWILLYYTLKIVRNNSRTIQIFKGIILVLVVQSAATFFGFRTVAWMANTFVTWGFLAVIIIFQPEIRSLLEKLGKSSVFTRISTLTGNEKEQLVDELVLATTQLSEDRIGALITIEQSQSLIDYIRTGSPMNSIVTSDVLRSIFSTSTPIHDGAVIIQGDRISCASAYFPPTNLELPSRYGARHRAALGISEITDSITIVVSEETGRISIAEEGSLIPMNSVKLREHLNRMIIEEEVDIDIKRDKPKRGIFSSKEPVEVVVEDESINPLGSSHADVSKGDPLLKRLFVKKQKSKQTSKPVIEFEQEIEKKPTSTVDASKEDVVAKSEMIEVEKIEQTRKDEDYKEQANPSEDLADVVDHENDMGKNDKQGGE